MPMVELLATTYPPSCADCKGCYPRRGSFRKRAGGRRLPDTLHAAIETIIKSAG
jgi:hypothetical protein